MTKMFAVILALALGAAVANFAQAQDGSCSSSKPCPPGYCCSKWNYCGQGSEYCGNTPPAPPYGGTPPHHPSPSHPSPPHHPSPPSPPSPSHPGGKGKIAAYWGQNGNEGPLDKVCASDSYEIILLSFLNEFGNFQRPMLNLAGHCDPYSHGCTVLSGQIKSCQSSGVKVLLSLGGGDSPGRLVSDADAADLAKRLWASFLGGDSSDRPLGDAVLDGIDLDVESGATPELYAGLVRHLRSIAGSSKVLVSAAPQCPFPDANLGSAVQTPGLFDFIFVQFYNNPPCAYVDGDDGKLLDSWKQWTSSIPSAKIYLGLPASPSAAGSGFLPAHVATSSVLPEIKSSHNYGGVMLWSVFYDQQESYSESIQSSV
ncbi:acidic endochitinase [Selaginella moellendorffii]|nr:acidic endochitinase [Selaginella moellendorffii]|eukprot:XP_002976060.2 acidic endochitinase [Selaginella moellendorffii]